MADELSTEFPEGLSPAYLQDFLNRLLLPWTVVTDLQRDAATLRFVLADLVIGLKEIKVAMAADRELLAQLASDVTTLATPVQALIDSEHALRARVAELEGQAVADEAGDLAAAQEVKDAFDALAGKFTAEPEAPNVEPLPEPTPEPAPADGTTDVTNPTPGSQ